MFIWQGGEPTLMGLDFFRRAIAFGEEEYRRPAQEVSHSLQTNGVLINDEWAQFLPVNNFLVGLSIYLNPCDRDGIGLHPVAVHHVVQDCFAHCAWRQPTDRGLGERISDGHRVIQDVEAILHGCQLFEETKSTQVHCSRENITSLDV